jgi:hypothetical protein
MIYDLFKYFINLATLLCSVLNLWTGIYFIFSRIIVFLQLFYYFGSLLNLTLNSETWACFRIIRFVTVLKLFYFSSYIIKWSRDSDWLRAERPRGRSSSPGRVKNFSLLHIFQRGSEVHPTSYPMDTGGYFSGGKSAGEWNWPLTSNYCRGQENVDRYIYSPIHLHGVVLN